MKASEFVTRMRDVAENYKTYYVNGCFGAPITSSNISRYTTNTDYNIEHADEIRAISDKGYFGFDCVCTIKGILWGWSGDENATYGGAKYVSNGVPDLNADAMIAVCKEVSTDFSTIQPGEAVHIDGHIGVYLGDLLVAECTPRWSNGVQITALANLGTKKGYNSRTWTRHGKLPYVEYTTASSSSTSKADYYLKNSRVGAWQKAMNTGFDTAELKVDNIFGPASQTFADTHKLWTGQTHNCPTAIKWLQGLLNTRFAAKLTVDGKFGPKTKAAVIAVQKKFGLTQDGIVGLVTTYYLLK